MEIQDKDGNLSRELYIFLRYNQIRNKLESELSKHEEKVYQEFNRLFKELKTSLERGDSKASSLLGNIMNLFGFDRRYDAMSGLPIIGKFYKINGRTVNKESYDSWKLVQEMQKIEEIEHSKQEPHTLDKSNPKKI